MDLIEALAKLADANGLRALDIIRGAERWDWAWDLLEGAGLDEATESQARKADMLNQEKMTELMEKVK